MLSIVSTPIGNLEDITLRALRALKEADYVVAEDTRHTGILLKKFEIATPLLSFHSYSTDNQIAHILVLLREGKHLALVSDAGTPGISDPGYLLIKKALDEKLPLTVIPGPSAAITALVSSGLPIHRFIYLGYLPIKKGRKTLLESLKDLPYTIVLYEAPHRILRTLTGLRDAWGNRQIAVCRELTKVFEEVFRGTMEEALQYFTNKKPRGEFTLVIGGVADV